MFQHLIGAIIVGLVVSAACVLAGALAELRRPARPVAAGAMGFNAAYGALGLALQTVAKPLLAGGVTLVVGSASGGLIRVPASGWGLVLGTAAYVLAMDLGEYLFHRAQHAFAPMWSLHSLHHSEEMFNVTTTVRHHWLDFFLKSCSIYAIIGLIFKVDTTVIGIYALLGLLNYFNHLNVDVGFGRLSFLLNSPSYHRRHHSRLAEHYNSNFAALFPIWDVISGAYHVPARGDIPPTGLDSHAPPRHLLAAFAWPFWRTAREASSPLKAADQGPTPVAEGLPASRA